MKRWPLKPLGDVCDINPRLTALEHPSPDVQVSFIPMAAIDEVSGSIVGAESRRYSEVAKGYTSFREGDVLFAKITPCMQNGKAAIARNLLANLGFGSTEFHVLRPHPALLPEWVFAFILQPSFRSAAMASFTGSAGQQRVPARFISNFPIPVPPLPEQERIVNLLAEADNLRKLRARADRRTAELIPALFHEMFGDPARNTKRWPLCRLDKVAKIQTGTTPSTTKAEYYDGDIPFVRPAELGDFQPILRAEKCLTDGGVAVGRVARKGATLVGCIGQVGKTGITGTMTAFNQQINSVEFSPNVNDDYGFVCCRLMAPIFRARAAQALLPILNKSRFSEIEVPVPPTSLQRTFSERITEVRKLALDQAASRFHLDALFQSLLHLAFNGGL